MKAPIPLLVFAVLSLPGCTVGPDYVTPKLAVPKSFLAPTDKDPNEVSYDDRWWPWVDDEVLTGLVLTAQRSNTDVRVAIARLREARAGVDVTNAQQAPQIDATGSYSNSQFSKNGFLKGLGGGSGSPPGAIFPGQRINLHELGLDASWELDLFGGVRRAGEAAQADYDAADSDLYAVLVSLTGEVASTYIEWCGLQERMAITQRTTASLQATVDVLAEQAKAGVIEELELVRAQGQVATAGAELPRLESEAHAAMRRLEVLLGAMPGTLDAELAHARPVPKTPDVLAVEIPSRTLSRRFDVHAAERRLAAATARIGVATADLLPRFSLTGQFGLQSQRLDELPSNDSVFWLLGPAVRWPLLDFGRVRANIRVQDASAEQALANYEGVVVRALSEVEVALVRINRDRRRLEQMTKARAAGEQAVVLAEERYRSGLSEFLDLLEMERARDAAAIDELLVRQTLALDVVGLGKAIGCGVPGSGSVGGTGSPPDTTAAAPDGK